MHPFSLTQQQTKAITGGTPNDGKAVNPPYISFGLNEGGDITHGIGFGEGGFETPDM